MLISKFLYPIFHAVIFTNILRFAIKIIRADEKTLLKALLSGKTYNGLHM